VKAADDIRAARRPKVTCDRSDLRHLAGDRDVASIHANVARLMEGIAGAGHRVDMEKPAEFDAAVLPFLEAQAARK
jgi:pimeloyl-ACP methyl ester carboxylesterase